MPKRGDAIPWKASAVTPNFGNSPDQTDDMRGGMAVAGVANLQKFIEDGGMFITIAGVARYRSTTASPTGVSIQQADRLQARGSIYNSRSRIARVRLHMATMTVCRSTSVSRRCFRLLTPFLDRVAAAVVAAVLVLGQAQQRAAPLDAVRDRP